MHFLSSQAAGQWLSTKTFPNLTPNLSLQWGGPKEPCSTMGNPSEPIRIDGVPFKSLAFSICKIGASNMIIFMGPLNLRK